MEQEQELKERYVDLRTALTINPLQMQACDILENRKELNEQFVADCMDLGINFEVRQATIGAIENALRDLIPEVIIFEKGQL